MAPEVPEDLLDRLGPCGLHCGGCLAFQGGKIQTHAQALKELLGPNFQAYAERLGDMDPAFGDYPEFARFLDFLANGQCSGCRGGGCRRNAAIRCRCACVRAPTARRWDWRRGWIRKVPVARVFANADRLSYCTRRRSATSR